MRSAEPFPPPDDGLRPLRGRLRLAAVLAALAGAACGDAQPPTSPEPRVDSLLPVPSYDDPATVDVATWNLEWFGHPELGPTDEKRQLLNVASVIRGMDVDLWALQEVSSEAAFLELLTWLPGYEGLLADDPSVEGGEEHYGPAGGLRQKVAVLWRRGVVRGPGAPRVVLGEAAWAFAGRPPLQFRISPAASADPFARRLGVLMLVLHAKAGAAEEDRQRRAAAAAALRAHLDVFRSDRILVLGDFNDDVDTSIVPGRPSPYADFVADTAYAFATEPLSLGGASASVSFPDLVDHHLVTNEVVPRIVPGSAQVVGPELPIPDWGVTTSDHYVVLVRYRPEPG